LIIPCEVQTGEAQRCTINLHEILKSLLWQRNSDALMNEKEQKFNKSKKEEVIPRYKFVSPPYY
jgi:hypothetical protein